MPSTTIATGDAVAVKVWDRDFIAEMPKKVFFAQFAGRDPNNICITKVDLNTKPGDRITVSLFPNLDGAGIQGETDIEGQEEPSTLYSDNVGIDFYAHAWKVAGLITEQRSPADLRKEARRVLSVWGGEKLDSLAFTAIESSPSRIYTENTDALVANGPTASILATDLIEPMMASYLRAAAYTVDPKITPIQQGGKEVFVLLMHTHCGFDMKNDATWQTFHTLADVRDPKDNYLFKSGMGTVDDVLLYTSESVATATTWGAGAVYGARNKFLGARAMAQAWAKYPFMVEKRFQYGTQWGAMIGFTVGYRKLVFNAQDFSLFELRTARTAIN